MICSLLNLMKRNIVNGENCHGICALCAATSESKSCADQQYNDQWDLISSSHFDFLPLLFFVNFLSPRGPVLDFADAEVGGFLISRGGRDDVFLFFFLR